MIIFTVVRWNELPLSVLEEARRSDQAAMVVQVVTVS